MRRILLALGVALGTAWWAWRESTWIDRTIKDAMPDRARRAGV